MSQRELTARPSVALGGWARAVRGVQGRVRAFALQVELSLASPDEAGRWADAQPTRLRRALTAALVARAVAHPERTGRLIRRRLPDGLRYLGVGYHSVVYRCADGRVIKVNRRTIHVSEQRRQEVAAAERRLSDVVEAHLADLPIPQDVVVGVHPAAPRLRAVMIVQDFQDYLPLDEVFPPDRDSIDVDALRRLLDEHPSLRTALRQLARGGLAMAERERLVPDVLGRGNIGVVMSPGPRLVVVDRQPMDASRPLTTMGRRRANELVIPQLQSLLAALGDTDDGVVP